MIGLIIYLIAFQGLSVAQVYQEQGFKRTSLACFETLDTTELAKTLIECCSFCLPKPDCQGVTFDGKTCTFLTDVIIDENGASQAWIMEKTLSKECPWSKVDCKLFRCIISHFDWFLFQLEIESFLANFSA